MEESFNPQQSLALITKVISEAKQKVEEDGVVYIFWGFLTTLIALSQFTFLQIDSLKNWNFMPYFFMPLGSLFTAWYYSKKVAVQNILQQSLKKLWIVISVNIYLLSFVFFGVLVANLIPIILLLIGIGFFITAWSIQSKPLQVGGLVLNISGLCAFYIPLHYQSLCLAGASFLGVFCVGLYLFSKQKKRV